MSRVRSRFREVGHFFRFYISLLARGAYTKVSVPRCRPCNFGFFILCANGCLDEGLRSAIYCRNLILYKDEDVSILWVRRLSVKGVRPFSPDF